MSYKQVIVMRTDLNMRKGKMVAQGAHAAVMPFLQEFIGFRGKPRELRIAEWVSNFAMTKICVGVDSEVELDAIESRARAAKIDVYYVIDAGKTEFGGVPTKTCLSLGPDYGPEIDKITGGLRLL